MNKQTVSPIDVTNDELMVREGIRNPNLVPRDQTLWSKTPEERKKLKKFRRLYKMHSCWSGPEKVIDVPGKLIIYLKNPKTSKTTLSYKCIQSDIPFLLANKEVLKYSWNGRTYYKGLPVW